MKNILNIKIRIFTVIFLLMTVLCLEGQSINGTYICGEQQIRITENLIEYNLISFGGGISTPYMGKGTFRLDKNRFHIEPEGLDIRKTSNILPVKQKLQDTISILGSEDGPNQIALTFYSKNKEIFAKIFDSKEGTKIPKNTISNCDSFSATTVGYKPVVHNSVDINSFDYIIKLHPYSDSNLHYDFITNDGKGFKSRISKNKITLRYKKLMNYPRQKDKLKNYTFKRKN